MPKGKAQTAQLGFCFELPAISRGEAGGAGLEQRISRAAGNLLATAQAEGRSRAVIAAEMSDWLAEDVTVDMLNAMSSPARSDHKVHMSRFWALLAVTGRPDVLDPLLREIGAALLVGREVQTARIGHLSQKLKEIRAELRDLERSAPIIREGKD